MPFLSPDQQCRSVRTQKDRVTIFDAQATSYRNDLRPNCSGGSVLVTEVNNLTLLVGRQEGHPACKITGCWFVGGDDLTGALHNL